jgi:hypothetical protein
MLINGREYKPYDEHYYVSEDGDVHSKYINRSMKHNIDLDGYHRVDIHGKHMKVHKLVYNTWVGDVEPGKLIRHYDDNRDNNHLSNLVVGTQKDNIADAIRNGHRDRGGRTHTLVVYDKLSNECLTFCPAEKFIEYSGHSCQNGGISRMMTRDWFKKRFEVMEYRVGKV